MFVKIHSLVAKLFCIALCLPRICYGLSNSAQVPVLLYHPQGNQAPCDYGNNPQLALQQDLEYMYSQGYTVVPDYWIAQWVVGDRDGSTLPDKVVGVTFDDGVDSTWIDNAFPNHPCTLSTGQPVKSFKRILQDFKTRHPDLPWYSPHASVFVLGSPVARQSIDDASFPPPYGTSGTNDHIRDNWWYDAQASGFMEIYNHGADHDALSITAMTAEPAFGSGIYLAIGGYGDNSRSGLPAGTCLSPDPSTGSTVWQGYNCFFRVNNFTSAHHQVVDSARYIYGKTGVWPDLFAYPFGQASIYMATNYFPNNVSDHATYAAFCTEYNSVYGATTTYVSRSSPRYCLGRFTHQYSWATTAGLATILPPASTTPTNVAASSAGAIATASSTVNSNYPVSAVNDGNRTGSVWGAGGGWADGTPGSYPDWVQIRFNGVKILSSVVVYTLQDVYWSPYGPVEPSDTMTFSNWGITSFNVQGWSGSSWTTLATVTGNNLVKRTVTFAPFATDRIRVVVNASLGSDQYSRIVEIEAFGVAGGPTKYNVASASSGATATASSTVSSNYPVSAIIDGNRTGAVWGSGGGWADGTPGTYPDWAEVDFNGLKIIDSVDVYTLQDVYWSPVEPSDTMTFSNWGITSFDIQGWNGSSWITLGSVTGNNLVKRTVDFNPFATDRIRVQVNSSLGSDQYSRIVEVAAWGI